MCNCFYAYSRIMLLKTSVKEDSVIATTTWDTSLAVCSRPFSIVLYIYLFIYFGFYIAFNTVQVISRWVTGRAEDTSTYSSLGFWTVNCQPTASNYQLSHLRPYREPRPQRWEARVLPLCHRLPLIGFVRTFK